jgi:type I protein arginine methyltransferase
MEFQGSEEADFAGESLWQGISSIEDPNSTFGADYYFDSYSHFGIHEDMIKDTTRTVSYKNAIMRNSYLFKDKIVMDIGCGTGILSFFAAKAGAKHVYGIDCADIINYAREIVRINEFSDKITLIKGKIEEIVLPVPTVDIIISEWMGYFLIYEGMLDSVLYARDKWLAPGGMLFPDKARIWLAAVEDGKFKKSKIEFWNDVYGICMRPMRDCVLIEPVVDVVENGNIISSLAPIFEADLEKVTKAQLSFTSSFRMQFTRKDQMHGFVGWFEVGFTHCHRPVTLSTSPKYKSTHWKQTIFYLDPVVNVEAGQILEGSIAVRYNPLHPRELDIKLSFNVQASNTHGFQFYRLR